MHMNEWTVVRTLGSGGTAEVDLVTRPGEARTWALKRGRDAASSALVLAEARALEALRHPAVPLVEACGLDRRGRGFYVREAVDGATLDRFLAGAADRDSVARRLFAQALDFLLHLASLGRSHGDLKPANLLVAGQGGGARLRILDLGGAQDVLTPEFTLPERLGDPSRPATLADDLFALAVSFWVALEGAHPLPGYPQRVAGTAYPGKGSREPWRRFLGPQLALGATRPSDVPAVLRHWAATMGDEPCLPLPETVAWRLDNPPSVAAHAEVGQAVLGWLLGAEPAWDVACLAGPAGCGRSHLLRQLGMEAGQRGAAVHACDLAMPGRGEGLLAEAGKTREDDRRPQVILLDHFDRAPMALRDRFRRQWERWRVDPSSAPRGRWLVVAGEGAAPGPAFQLEAMPTAVLEHLVREVFFKITVRPSDVTAWARAAAGCPRALLSGLGRAVGEGRVEWAGGTLELGAPPLCQDRDGAGTARSGRLPAKALELQLARALEAFRADQDAVAFAWAVLPLVRDLSQARPGPAGTLLEVAEVLGRSGEAAAARACWEAVAGASGDRRARLGLARQDLRAGAWEGVEDWMGRLAEPWSSDEALLACEAHLLRGRYEQAQALVAAHAPTGEALDTRWERLSAMLAFYRADYPAALRAIEACLALAGSAATPEALNLAGIVEERQGRYERAEERYAAALEAARRAWDRTYLWKVAMNLGVLHQRTAEPYRALERYREALALAEATGNAEGRRKVSLNLGNLLLGLGRAVEALPPLATALAEAERLGDAFTHACALSMKGEALRHSGELAGALEALGQAETRLRQAGNQRECLQTGIELARAELDAGRHETARLRLGGVRRQAEAAGLGEVALEAQRTLALDLAFTQRAGGPEELAAALGELADDPSPEAAFARWRRAMLAGESGALDLAERCRAALEKRFEALVPADRARLEASEPWRRMLADLDLFAAFKIGADQRTAGRLRALLAVAGRLNSAEDERSLLDGLLDEAIAFTGAERGFILLKDGRGLRAFAARNIDREAVRGREHKVSYGIARDVLASGQPVATVDALADERFREYLSIHKLRLRSVLCHPLSVRGVAEGVLYLDNRFAPSLFGEDELYAVGILADQVGVALARLRMLEDLASRESELTRSRAEIARLNDRLRAELDETSRKLAQRERDLEHIKVSTTFPGIVGNSAALRRCLFMVERVHSADVPVLIQGESGTGKELVARAIHFQGRRKAGPFVAVNCGAIPENLFESELFGHRRGSFTGATGDKAGLFEAAHGGTLFLDEIGDLPPGMQVKLLRVLQSGEVMRVGDTRPVKVDVRVVAALNRDLKELVASGGFREDLFYRLNVVSIVLPALRERRDDIPLLVHHFLNRNLEEAFSHVRTIAPEALRLLAEHPWPGNVRQLETVIKNASLFCSGEELRPEDFSELSTFQGAPADLTRLVRAGIGRGLRMDDFEALLIRHTLELTQGNKKRAAELLGIDRRTLYNKLATMDG
jgi:transcriptional regulator with GAF, ATPase, and Fis domain/tetratricopeptide (TPR) repeat protein